jgi:hypothetical protein
VTLLLPFLAQITIAVSAPDSVPALQPIALTITVTAPSSRKPTIIMPDLKHFSTLGTSASTRIDQVGGRARVHHEVKLTLEAPSPGTYRIAAFEARVGAASKFSTPVSIRVTKAVASVIPLIVTRGTIKPGDPVTVAATVDPDTVYVGQQSTYQVAVFIEESVRNRLRRNPGFTPPEPRGMLAYDLAPPDGILPTRRSGDRRYEPHLYQRAIFPLVPGRHTIPPAELNYSLPLSYSFFSREESHVLRTDSLVLIARDVPAEGRPAGFLGAVGEFTVEAGVATGRARVGDPAVLTLKISGRGNIKMLPRPAITVPWGALIPAEERVVVDRTSEVIRGRKEFDWVLTPQVSGSHELPAMQYPFFNPRTEQYEIAVTRPETLSVAPGSLIAAEVAAADSTPLLPLRSIYRGEPDVPGHLRPGYWLLLATAPIPALVTAIVRRPRKRKVPTAAAILRGLKAKGQRLSPGDVRRAYVNALAQRLHLAAGTLATRAEFARALRRAGVSQPATENAAVLLGELDVAAYGMQSSEIAALIKRAQASYQAVDAEARIGTGAPVALAIPFLLTLGLAAAAASGFAATSQAAERAHFERGTRFYYERRFIDAGRSFGQVTSIAPDAADGWANLGTAAWAAGDTATAVVGWQRALRLEPIARDVRARLELVGSTSMASFAWVPPASTAGVAIAVAAIWVGAWLLALLRAAGRRGVSRRLVASLASLAMLLGAGAILLDERLAARKLVVVGETTPLRSLPALGADPVVTLHPGQIARSVHQQGEWTLVALDGEQEGWVTASTLVSLARDQSLGWIR